MENILQGIHFLIKASELLDEKYSVVSAQLLQLAYSILDAEDIPEENLKEFKRQVDELISSDFRLEDRK